MSCQNLFLGLPISWCSNYAGIILFSNVLWKLKHRTSFEFILLSIHGTSKLVKYNFVSAVIEKDSVKLHFRIRSQMRWYGWVFHWILSWYFWHQQCMSLLVVSIRWCCWGMWLVRVVFMLKKKFVVFFWGCTMECQKHWWWVHNDIGDWRNCPVSKKSGGRSVWSRAAARKDFSENK